jgi:polyisoprenyl-phosphate glycosyltransferase
LSIVSPVYRCAGCLEDLVERISASLAGYGQSFEIILVDDGSPDDAWARIRELAERHPAVRGIRLSRNFGQHYAIAAGIEHADGDRVVVMDCDLQDPPEEIPKLLALSDQGYDAVFARRLSRQDSAFKRFTSWAFYRLLTYLTDVEQDHTTANFGVFTRKAIATVNRMPEFDRCFPLMVKWTGFRMATVDVVHAERKDGRSSYDLRRMLRLALNIILSYSDKPLRLVVKLGLVFALFSFVIVALSVIGYLSGNVAVAGFTSIIASIWLLGGVMVSCVGIVGLYVGRLFNDTKRRPYYVVDEYANAPEGTTP